MRAGFRVRLQIFRHTSEPRMQRGPEWSAKFCGPLPSQGSRSGVQSWPENYPANFPAKDERGQPPTSGPRPASHRAGRRAGPQNLRTAPQPGTHRPALAVVRAVDGLLVGMRAVEDRQAGARASLPLFRVSRSENFTERAPSRSANLADRAPAVRTNCANAPVLLFRARASPVVLLFSARRGNERMNPNRHPNEAGHRRPGSGSMSPKPGASRDDAQAP